MQFDTLPGFREFYPEACARRNAIFDVWRRTAQSFNFLEYDAPVLEPLELYIEKSGEEIVGQLFNFEDRGGRAVAMRPEMTPSLARLVGAKANSLKRPVKWFSVGEFYRYERPQKGRLRAFYQFNVDIFGEPGSGADAELIALCVQTLKGFGLSDADFKIRLSDRDLWLLMLAAEGLDDAASMAVLGIIDKMERMDREKVIEKLAEVFGDAAEAFFGRIEEAVAIREFDALCSYIEALPLEGELADKAAARLDDWRSLMASLTNAGAAGFIQIDLGIVRGLAYYTGFVFEAFEATGAGRALAGGGRYDALVKKLGGPEMPAVGFAMGDVTLADLLESKGRLPDVNQAPDCIAIIGGAAARPAAMEDAATLRAAGVSVDYPLKDQGFGKQFKAATQSGASFALIYGSEELERGVVKVRDLKAAEEQDVAREELLLTICKLLNR
ncbi:histidine--tRNA ligase [Coraliomargarita akajimensis]|uniref:Histidine--tRNA ligase n=1 Tax=Coraliomargarita akajimensis (strain DSM 45221 / IAM 15411 / JCM 23193 / KCTC 12865 / 04OKA010-24) TaxID=583355 RepID=D5EKF6_CORAD|nr:histidine--tRNA ligase [Coraliomargarita akajimensis]ADE53037.1 histidyl-tRNA synthetase [Coraliomargarita akajimensis DSM 45221]